MGTMGSCKYLALNLTGASRATSASPNLSGRVAEEETADYADEREFEKAAEASNKSVLIRVIDGLI